MERETTPNFVLISVLIALFGVSFTASSSLGFERQFETWWGFDTGAYGDGHFPYAFRVADLDADGDPDVVSCHWFWPKQVSVILNDGSGGFGEPVYFATGDSAFDLEVTDLDGDGLPEIITANTGSVWAGTTVSVLRNEGGGVFSPNADFPALTGPIGITSEDFDGDGHRDIAVAGWERIGQGTQIAVLHGDGAGNLGTPELHFVGSSPYKLAAGDLDGDSRPDLAVGRDGRRLAILLNSALGFQPVVEYVTGDIPWAGDAYANVELADVDLDGDLDVFYTSTKTILNIDQGAVALFRNTGDGTLQDAEYVPLVPALGGGSGMVVKDVTGDGWVDLMTAHLDAGGWTLQEGDGGGGFLPGRELTGGQDPIGLAVADADGDGDEDVIVLNRSSLNVSVHPNVDGLIADPPIYDTNSLARHMDASDIDHDGDLDLVSSGAYAGAGGIGVAKNFGDGTFTPYVLYQGAKGAMAVKLRDMNGDSFDDLLWADDPTSPPYDFKIRLNQGDGTFGPEVSWSMNTCGTGDIEACDIDDDGDLDVLMTDYLGCAGGQPSPWVWIRRNNGDATFSAPYVVDVELSPEIVRCGDFNEDGITDVVVTASNDVRVLISRGNGGFDPFAFYPTSEWGPKDIAMADLNGDGHLDIATCNLGDEQESMSVLLGLGDGTFGPAAGYLGAYCPDYGVKAIESGDVDGDGDFDLLVLNYAAHDVSYYENRGDGTFAPHVRYGVGPSANDFVYGEFTGDEVDDIAAVVGIPPYNLGRAFAIVPGLGPAPASTPTWTTSPLRLDVVGPHPARGSVTFSLSLGDSESLGHSESVGHSFSSDGLGTGTGWSLEVFDVSGRRVASLGRGLTLTGEGRVEWSGQDGDGQVRRTGIYLVRLATSTHSLTRKVTLLP